MRAPRVAARSVVADFPPDVGRAMSNGCPQVEAMDRQTAALEVLTAELRAAREALTPAALAITDLGTAQKKLCRFIVGHRLKLAASVPIVLTLVGGLSPNVANVMGQLLKVWGVQ